MEYNFTKLWENSFFGFNQFKVLYEYVSDKEAQFNYYKNKKVVRYDSISNEQSEMKMSQEMVYIHLENIENALRIINNQFIVFLFTKYESIIQDTVKCIVINDPKRMFRIKGCSEYEKVLGFSLREFIEKDSKEQYLKILAERLCSKVLNGKPEKVISRLKSLLDFKISYSDINILNELMDKRNCIVHEGCIYDLDIDKIENYYITIDKLLKELALAIKNNYILIIDEEGVLD